MTTKRRMGSSLLRRWDEAVSSGRLAIWDGAGRHDYPSLDRRARRLGSALLEGKPSLAGERIGLLVEPGAAFVHSLFAIFRSGGCAVVLSPLHPAAETAYFLADAGIRTVVASARLQDRLPKDAPLQILSPEAGSWERALPEVSDEDAALQVYTSGTTGKPKGAVLTHANLAAQQSALNAAWEMRADDLLLHCLPLHHVHGLSIALLNVLGAGGAARMLDGFDAATVWEAMGESTVFMAVPTIYARLLAAWDAAPPQTQQRWAAHAQNLRLATSGSAALPVTLGERWRALTGTFPLERYGMTEIGVALSNPLAPAGRIPGSVGAPLPSVRVRIVDEAGQPADAGELWVAGPSVFPGYFRRDSEGAFTLVDGQRYFRTGDTVERAADGTVRILGRTSVDILKSGGYKLSAIELEELLRGHPAIAEVAVVGIPDEVWGQRVIACAIPRPGHPFEEEAIRAWVKERAAAYKVPRHVLPFEALPRNAMGKVVKPELVRVVEARLAPPAG